MCGRFALGINHEDVFNQLIADGLIPGDEDPEWVDRADFYPRYNIAPRSRAPVVRQRRAAPNEERAESPSRLEPVESSSNNESPSSSRPQSVFVQTMRWGLVPQHAKEDAPSLTTNTINARVETILQGGSMWYRLAASKRCVVVCDGYYEWLTKGKTKLPHFIRHPEASKKLYMAGFWDEVVFADSPPLFTFSIVTLPARADMEWLHDRMPLIFSPTSQNDMERLKLWLDPTKGFKDGIRSILELYQHDAPAEPFTIYQVRQEVGKVGAESPTFIEPIDQRKDGIKAMFAKSQQKASNSSGSTAESALKRSRSLTPDNQASTGPDTKKPKFETPMKKQGPSRATASPKKPKAAASPRKKKIDASPSKSISDFFPVTSPRKGAPT